MRIPPLVVLALAASLAVGCQTTPTTPARVAPAPVRMDGEFVDLHCFIEDPERSRGFSHARCANEGIR